MQVTVFLYSLTLVDTATDSFDTSGINNPMAVCNMEEGLNPKFDDMHFMGGIY